MAIQFRNSGNASTFASNLAGTINTPSGTSVGDALILYVSWIATGSIAGWNTLQYNSFREQGVFWKIADGSDSVSFSAYWSWRACLMFSFYGDNGAIDVSGSSIRDNWTTSSANFNAVNADWDVWFAFSGAFFSSAAFVNTYPSWYTNGIRVPNFGGNNRYHAGWCHKIETTSSETPSTMSRSRSAQMMSFVAWFKEVAVEWGGTNFFTMF